ncbi:MAG: DEAD/DEAH box helicase [Bacteroidales bacterium]|nr:DEAD/DEAH box helicase [Bacteroidales bacterium]
MFDYLLDKNNDFFAVSLQEHKHLGSVLVAHVVKLMSREGGIFSIVDNVFPENLSSWNEHLPQSAGVLVRLIDETSDSSLYRVLGGRYKSVAHFFEAISTDKVFGDYVVSYVNRRVAKCFEVIANENIPTFLRDKKFNNLYLDQSLEYSRHVAKPIFQFSVNDNETRYTLQAVYNGSKLSLKNRNAAIISYMPCVVRLDKRVLRFNDIDAKKLIPFFDKDYVTIPKSAERKYFETFVLNTIRNGNSIVEANGFNINTIQREKKAVLMLEPTLSGTLSLILYFRYDSKDYLSHSKAQNEVLLNVNGGYSFSCFARDTEWESEVKQRLIQIGLQNRQGAEFSPISMQTEHDTVEWLNRNADLLFENNIIVEQRVQGARYYIEHFNLDLKAKFSNDWFDVFGMVTLCDYQFPFILLRKNILKDIREYILPNGEIFVIPEEWFARYKPLLAIAKSDGDKLKVSQSSFEFINQAKVECAHAKELKERFESHKTFSKCVIPHGLNATLRDYQKIGLLWLQMLNELGMGGCLADDMGLGKTIQALAVLLYDKENNENRSANTTNGMAQMGNTSLLVVPTSLIFNWQREINQFAPSLSVYQFVGSSRTKQLDWLTSHDIVITTYGVLRNEIELLKDIHFNYVVLDESQTIKNPMSKGYRSSMLLKAKHFLSLSGTPIENSLSDLWAQLNFLNRGMLGSFKTFRNEYIDPIERDGDEVAREKLKMLVKPFILRRSKQEVAPELPQLSEQVVYCNLTDGQKTIYEKEKSEIRNHIMGNIESNGYGQSSISIFRGLTRLRQIANHPDMIDEYTNFHSGKFDEVCRTIQTLVDENHKVLIFSSFVKHLRIVEDFIKQIDVGYQMLIGSTRNRDQVVDDFQNDPSTQVFLISIKAGGVGLNLTAADYIIILDPWWNPAVENQAIARAHRLGQDKNVFVYRFISVDTVEEKIRKLQESKQLLSDEFVNGANPLSALGQDKILELLS